MKALEVHDDAPAQGMIALVKVTEEYCEGCDEWHEVLTTIEYEFIAYIGLN